VSGLFYELHFDSCKMQYCFSFSSENFSAKLFLPQAGLLQSGKYVDNFPAWNSLEKNIWFVSMVIL